RRRPARSRRAPPRRCPHRRSPGMSARGPGVPPSTIVAFHRLELTPPATGLVEELEALAGNAPPGCAAQRLAKTALRGVRARTRHLGSRQSAELDPVAGQHVRADEPVAAVRPAAP